MLLGLVVIDGAKRLDLTRIEIREPRQFADLLCNEGKHRLFLGNGNVRMPHQQSIEKSGPGAGEADDERRRPAL